MLGCADNQKFHAEGAAWRSKLALIEIANMQTLARRVDP